MGHLRSQIVWWGLIAIVVALASCGLVGLLHWQADPSTQLVAAQARWAARPFSHYRMVIETSPTCQSAVEVRDEQVVHIFHTSSCGVSSQTVAAMFDMLKRNRPVNQACTFYKCACGQTIAVYATFDAQLGYPHRIAVWLQRDINWTATDLWLFVWSFWKLPDCQRTADIDIFSVVSLEPLP